MILQTKTIRTFLSESSVVRPNVLHPNLNDVIKIECKNNNIVFTKTNMNIFCTYTIEDTGFHIDDECYLVGERTLNGLAQTTHSDTISIEQKENMLHIKGSKIETVQCPALDLAMFPNTPTCTSEQIQLDAEVLYCIRVAGNYINTDEKITPASFVNITENGVFSTNNNNIVYYRKFGGLPNIFLDASSMSVIKTVNGATYSMHENYDFINYDNFSFGVRKSGIVEKPIDYLPIVNANAIFNFEIELTSIIDYCTLVNYAAKSKYPIISLKYDGEVLNLNHDDADFNIHVNKQYTCLSDGEPMDNFKFCVKYMELFLKHLPYTNLIFSRAGNHFKITTTEDENFIGIFAGQA